MYVKGKSIDEKIFWKREKCFSFKLHARIHTVEEIAVKRIGEHDYTTDAGAVSASKAVNEIKHRPANRQDSAHHIIAEATAGWENATAAKLPRVSTIKRTVRRIREVVFTVVFGRMACNSTMKLMQISH